MRGMDFGISSLAADVFVRYRHEVPGFQLVRARNQLAVVDRLLLHIDFPSAEADFTTGPQARGTGVLEYFRDRPPEIISRDVHRAGVARSLGFVLDIASPYALETEEGQLAGIDSHVFASGLTGAKEAFLRAYEQYKKVEGNNHGVPVFDVYGWETKRDCGAIIHKPRFQLCGFSPSMVQPLEPEYVVRVSGLRDERMTVHNLHRPRLGVLTSFLVPTSTAVLSEA